MLRTALSVVAIASACGCAPSQTFKAPEGSRTVALDVRLPVHVLGTWIVDSEVETLTEVLKRYNVHVAKLAAASDPIAVVDLGRITYRLWQEIDVSLVQDGKTAPVGRIGVPDLEWTTLQAAAIPAAELIARAVWGALPAPPAP
jgi:hypothetical protein